MPLYRAYHLDRSRRVATFAHGRSLYVGLSRLRLEMIPECSHMIPADPIKKLRDDVASLCDKLENGELRQSDIAILRWAVGSLAVQNGIALTAAAIVSALAARPSKLIA